MRNSRVLKLISILLTCSIIIMSSGVMVLADEVDLFGSDRSSEDVGPLPAPSSLSAHAQSAGPAP